MNLRLIIPLLIIAYLIWVTHEIDREMKAAKKRQKELEAEWHLRRAVMKGQVWPKA